MCVLCVGIFGLFERSISVCVCIVSNCGYCECRCSDIRSSSSSVSNFSSSCICFGILADAVDSSLGGMLEVIPQGDETEALFGISGV